MEDLRSTYHTFDFGEGLPVFFQHGLGADIKQIESLLSPIKKGRFLGMDCPGHGIYPVDELFDYSFSSYVEQVIKLVHSKSISQAVFGGLSMGSGISLQISLRYPSLVSGLILLRPAWLDQKQPDNLKILLNVANHLQQENGKLKFEQLPEFQEINKRYPLAGQSILGLFSENQQDVLPQVLRSLVNDSPVLNLDELDAIDCPCLIIGNHDDPLHPFYMAETLHERINNSILETVPSKYVDSVGHQLLVKRHIVNFLKTI